MLEKMQLTDKRRQPHSLQAGAAEYSKLYLLNLVNCTTEWCACLLSRSHHCRDGDVYPAAAPAPWHKVGCEGEIEVPFDVG